MAAHPVRDGEEPELVVDEEGVLVVVPHPADVRDGTDDRAAGSSDDLGDGLTELDPVAATEPDRAATGLPFT